MKALSICQPWAELVLQGRKTMDLRTYTTRYRGPLAIYASQTVEADNARQHGLYPAGRRAGIDGLAVIRRNVDRPALSHSLGHQ